MLGNQHECLCWRRLSIITSKAQTTRHRILGIVNGRFSNDLIGYARNHQAYEMQRIDDEFC
jgi:hypothetical protein